MELVIKYLEAHRESILMDLELIKNDTKTRYAIEKRKELEPFLEQITRAVAILSRVTQTNELLPHVSNSLPNHCSFWNKECFADYACENGAICEYDKRQ